MSFKDYIKEGKIPAGIKKDEDQRWPVGTVFMYGSKPYIVVKRYADYSEVEREYRTHWDIQELKPTGSITRTDMPMDPRVKSIKY